MGGFGLYDTDSRCYVGVRCLLMFHTKVIITYMLNIMMFLVIINGVAYSAGVINGYDFSMVLCNLISLIFKGCLNQIPNPCFHKCHLQF